MEDAISVLPAAHSEEPLIARLLQLCLHDLSEWAPLRVGPDGTFPYPWLALYWMSPRRHPYVIRKANDVVGFALVREKKCGENADWDFQFAEFFILHGARKQGAGWAAAWYLLHLHTGVVELSFDRRNQAARTFWSHVVAGYNPSLKLLPVDEHRERFLLNMRLPPSPSDRVSTVNGHIADPGSS